MHTVFVELVEEIGGGLVCGRQVELVTKSLETLDVHRLLPARVVVERRYNAEGEITCVVRDECVIRDTRCRYNAQGETTCVVALLEIHVVALYMYVVLTL